MVDSLVFLVEGLIFFYGLIVDIYIDLVVDEEGFWVVYVIWEDDRYLCLVKLDL